MSKEHVKWKDNVSTISSTLSTELFKLNVSLQAMKEVEASLNVDFPKSETVKAYVTFAYGLQHDVKALLCKIESLKSEIESSSQTKD
jgi:hypothetical protein